MREISKDFRDLPSKVSELSREEVRTANTDVHGWESPMDVRGDLQALDLKELNETLSESHVFFEGNPFVGGTLLTHPNLSNVSRVSAFMSPLSREEILYLKDPEQNASLPDLVADVIRRKLLRRTRRHKGELSLKDLENIETRAADSREHRAGFACVRFWRLGRSRY